MKLTGNTILITGGGSGIGKALAGYFFEKGNSVILASRDNEKLTATAHDIDPEDTGRITTVQLDVSDDESVDEAAKKIIADYPELNVLIHNAGIMRPETIGDGYVDTAEATIKTNLTGQIRLNSRLVSHIIDKDNATIMTVTSGLAFLPRIDFPTYCASKAALHSYTQSLRAQMRPHGVQVIELAPPYVQTELTGPDQANNPAAMPLDDFIGEVTGILESQPDVEEVLVERVQYQRTAESSGEYATRFKERNELLGNKV